MNGSEFWTYVKRPLFIGLAFAIVAVCVWAIVPIAKKMSTPRTRTLLLLETTEDVPTITAAVEDEVAAVIRKRVEGLGLAEPSISTIGSDRLLVEVRAAAGDAAKLRTALTQTGIIEFKICPPKIRDRVKADPQYAAYGDCGKVVYTGAELRSAHAGFGIRDEPEVDFTTKDPVKFALLTHDHIGQWLGIFLDGKYVSGATIEGVISDSGLIHGTFTKEQVAAIADELNAGVLPVPVSIVEPK